MKQTLFPLCLIFGLVVSLFAQDAIEVKKVDFNTTKDDWIQMEIELSCEENKAPDARDKRFVENVKVTAYLAYESKYAKPFDYYTSEVEIVIMEKGEDYNVYFYLPGLIVERDQIQPEEPKFYYVEVSVDGAAQAPNKSSKGISPNIPNLEAINSLKSKAQGQNEHLLMPIYLAPSNAVGRVSDLPVFLRRDVRQ
ncbi:MAG: hypothetical protein ACSHYA_13085 [Opitutaceae bacterium]